MTTCVTRALAISAVITMLLPIATTQPATAGSGYRKVGAPYTINGVTYVPREDASYRAFGIASWYGPGFHGRLTANGEIYDMHALTAAHPTLPLPSYVRVTNLLNGRSLLLRVNDRGPYVANRVIDVSRRAAELLGFVSAGTTAVQVLFDSPAPIGADDGRRQAFLAAQPWYWADRMQSRVPEAVHGRDDPADEPLTPTISRSAWKTPAVRPE